MISAVLFDMDGTMVNTERLWGVINQKLAEEYGAVWDPAVRVQMMGKKDAECLAVFKEYFHLDVPVPELVARRRAMLLEDLSMIETNEGLYETLDLLERLGIKKAVATASFREFTARILSTFDLERRFDAVVTGDDVTHSKPDPGLFLEAARRLGAAPTECLVLEDAQNGVEAAYRAGMKVFAIPHADSSNHDFSKATRILSSMKEIDRAMLLSLSRSALTAGSAGVT